MLSFAEQKEENKLLKRLVSSLDDEMVQLKENLMKQQVESCHLGMVRKIPPELSVRDCSYFIYLTNNIALYII